ncbi:hypothetical protein M758_UG199800 [Ceratodon purpureus]|nr:hypothetical protein M758_UG199800 [Ceratodon purpureus]
MRPRRSPDLRARPRKCSAAATPSPPRVHLKTSLSRTSFPRTSSQMRSQVAAIGFLLCSLSFSLTFSRRSCSFFVLFSLIFSLTLSPSCSLGYSFSHSLPHALCFFFSLGPSLTLSVRSVSPFFILFNSRPSVSLTKLPFLLCSLSLLLTFSRRCCGIFVLNFSHFLPHHFFFFFYKVPRSLSLSDQSLPHFFSFKPSTLSLTKLPFSFLPFSPSPSLFNLSLSLTSTVFLIYFLFLFALCFLLPQCVSCFFFFFFILFCFYSKLASVIHFAAQFDSSLRILFV